MDSKSAKVVAMLSSRRLGYEDDVAMRTAEPVCPIRCSGGQNEDQLKLDQLSCREKQIIPLVLEGKLNKQIAYELHLTEGTIKFYLGQIFRKLGVGNRTALAVWALTHGGDGTQPAPEKSDEQLGDTGRSKARQRPSLLA